MKHRSLGLVAGNPIAVQALGLCPALAVTTSFFSALGMAAVTLVVLLLSCTLASLLRRLFVGPLRLASCIVLVTTLVTVAELLLLAWQPQLARALGPFLPLVVVNCLILGRMLAFASRQQPLDSIVDAIGHGLGFAVVLMLMAIIRQLLGDGSITVWNQNLWPESTLFNWAGLDWALHQGQLFTPLHSDYGGAPLRLLQLPAGALLLLAYFSGFLQRRLARHRQRQLREDR